MGVRIGFLGAGLVAGLHARGLLPAADRVASIGVFDPDRQRAENFANAVGATVSRTEEELLTSSDAVYVCTWTSEHPRLVDAIVALRLAVFCEKPLAMTLQPARTMAKRVLDAGVINQVGLVLRSSPAFHFMRSLIQEPASGQVMSVTFRDDQYFPIHGAYQSTWRSQATKCGSGVLLEHSIHDLDILEFLLGPIDSVSAYQYNVHGFAGIEDAVSASLQFQGGTVGCLLTLWHDLADRDSRRVEVFCENLWCVLDGHHWGGPVYWRRGNGDAGALEGAALADHVAALGLTTGTEDEHFLDAVERGCPASPDFSVAVRAHTLVDVAYRSAELGGPAKRVPA